MYSLEDIYDADDSWWVVVRTTLLFAGSLVAAIGFVVAVASLVAGFGLGTAASLKVAALLGGALLLVGFLVPFARPASTRRSRVPAAVGIVLGVAGLALFWTRLPAGWTGTPSQLPPVAIGTYAAGLLVVFGAGLAGSADTRQDASVASDSDGDLGVNDSIGSVESIVETDADENRRERPGSALTVGDGGEQADDLQFFDDES